MQIFYCPPSRRCVVSYCHIYILAALVSRSLQSFLMRVRLNEQNGSAFVFLAGTLFSFSPLLFRWTSGESSEWLFLLWRSVGILVSGISAMAPERKNDLIKVSVKALIGATLASCMTGLVIGIF